MTIKLIHFLTFNNISLRIIDNKYFHNFVNTLNSKYQIPCRQTLTNNIIDYSKELKEKIKELF